MTSNANHRDHEFPAFASVNGAAGAGVESGHSMCDWLPNLMQDYSPNQTTTTTTAAAAAATASNFATTLVPSSHDYTASATPTSATMQQSPYSHQPEFVSGPSSTYLNAASAFSSSEDVYMNSFPGLSHTISSDNTVSRYTTTSPSTSSHQPSPDNFIHYKKDFRLDQSPFHSGGNFFGDLIHPASAGSDADHVANNAYHVPFGLDHFMDWGFDINNALDAAFITQAPAYPAPSVATANGGAAAPSNVLDEGQPQAVHADLNVNQIATNNGNTSSTEKQTTSLASTSSSESNTSTTTPRTAKRSSNTVTTATQSSKRRRTVMASASPATSLKSSTSSTADNSLNDPTAASSTTIVSAAEKRRRNTLAARRCRQRQLDRVAALESALEEALKEKDDAKVEIARLKGENEVLRSLIGERK